MSPDELKKQAAMAAMDYVGPGMVVGIGTGSTANYFIDLLETMKGQIEGAVASSVASEERLKAHGIPVMDLNSAGQLALYVDGADEADKHLNLIKGGGGALTREKIVAAASKTFVCIADESKRVDILGKFPLPVEVIPMARSYVARELMKLGGQPQLREAYTTDNGHLILDVHNLEIMEPAALEAKINAIAGVVTVGLFAQRGADILLLSGTNGVETLKR